MAFLAAGITNAQPQHGGLAGWLGNDGTFRLSSNAVTLPLGIPVQVPVQVAPRTLGAHAAFLEIVDPVTTLPVHRVGATIVAAHRLTAQNDYAVRELATAPWPRHASYFVDVPTGTTALHVTLKVWRGELWVDALHNLVFQASANRNLRDGQGIAMLRPVRDGQERTVIFNDPPSGVWELAVRPVKGHPPLEAQALDSAKYHGDGHYELTVMADLGHGAEASRPRRPPPPSSLRDVPHGDQAQQRLKSIVHAGQLGRQHDIPVDSGAAMLSVVNAGDLSPSRAVDLYLFNCTSTRRCHLADFALAGANQHEVEAANPTAGTWKLVVDAAHSAAGAIDYTLVVKIR